MPVGEGRQTDSRVKTERQTDRPAEKTRRSKHRHVGSNRQKQLAYTSNNSYVNVDTQNKQEYIVLCRQQDCLYLYVPRSQDINGEGASGSPLGHADQRLRTTGHSLRQHGLAGSRRSEQPGRLVGAKKKTEVLGSIRGVWGSLWVDMRQV